MKYRPTLFVLPVLLLCSMNTWGTIYKCTDARGKTQYSDKPCSDHAAVFTPQAAPAADENSAARMQKKQRLLNAIEEERNLKQRDAAQRKADEEERKRNCGIAQNRLRQLTQASRLYRLDEEGKQVNLSHEERARTSENARAEVARWCG